MSKISPNTVLNNMRLIHGEPKKKPAPNLLFYKTVLGYSVYKVKMNSYAYIVFDHNNELYYNFERVIEDEGDIVNDLTYNIHTYLIKV